MGIYLLIKCQEGEYSWSIWINNDVCEKAGKCKKICKYNKKEKNK